VGNLLLTVLLAFGWQWVSILERMGFIMEKRRLWWLIGFTGLLIIQQVYLAFPKPVERGTVEAQKPVIESYLQGFLRRYYDQISSLPSDPRGSPPCVRVNVMLPTKRLRGIGGTYLKIYHVACPPDIIYYDDEFSEVWKKREGTCGWAWEQGVRSIYDSKNAKLSLPAGRLTESQRRATSHLNSTLIWPIWDKDQNKVVGVLNLDSEQNIEKSFFLHDTIIDSTAACAQHLVAHCFPDGVAP
jgi:hypothetical protein